MRILFLAGLIIWICAGQIWAEPALMIKRHIFTPEAAAEQKDEAPVANDAIGSALEKEILFTGVMITPKGRQAIMTENARNEKTKQKHVLKAGDQIKGMTIKEIGPNYVLIASKENTTRMNLFKGAKARPASAPEPVSKEPGTVAVNPVNEKLSVMTAGAQQPGTGRNETTPVGPLPGQTPEKDAQSPFGGARSGNPAQDYKEPAPNPFVEILKKGAERNPPGSGSPSGFPLLNLPGGN